MKVAFFYYKMNTIQTGLIEWENCSLYYKRIFHHSDNQDKPTLVFLHDSWGCTEMWGDFPERLAQISGFNTLVYDRQGYGKSSPFTITKRTNHYMHDEADVLIKILNHFGIQKALLYGHSDGATIALIAAAFYPERFSAIILEGAHSFVEETAKETILDARERSKHSNLLKSLEKFHGNNTSELFRLWHETWLSPEFSHWTIVPVLSRIQCPVLAFQGDADQYGTVAQLNALVQEIQTPVTIAEIPHAEHTPRREAEKETLRLITDFLSRIV